VSEDIGLRIHLAERFDDLLAASHTDEPVMNNRNLHRWCPNASFFGYTYVWSERADFLVNIDRLKAVWLAELRQSHRGPLTVQPANVNLK
jgi:hypothetical protein